MQREHAKGLFILQPKYQDCMIFGMVASYVLELTSCAKVCGLVFLDRAFRVLIGWAGKLRSRGYK